MFAECRNVLGDRQNLSKDSIEDQLRACDRLAERNGFEVVAKFSDASMSGGTTQRPGYQELLAAVRRGARDVIIA